MLKIAQIIDKDTCGLQYIETYKGEILTQTITSGVHVFLVEVIDFDGETPATFIESREISVDLDNMFETVDSINELGETVQIQSPLTIREICEESL